VYDGWDGQQYGAEQLLHRPTHDPKQTGHFYGVVDGKGYDNYEGGGVRPQLGMYHVYGSLDDLVNNDNSEIYVPQFSNS